MAAIYTPFIRIDGIHPLTDLMAGLRKHADSWLQTSAQDGACGDGWLAIPLLAPMPPVVRDIRHSPSAL